MKELIRTITRQAIDDAIRMKTIAVEDPDSLRIEVTRTKDEKFGDYATNIALVLAGKIKKKPRDVAAVISDCISVDGGVVQRVEVAGPGFINFFLSDSVQQEILSRIHTETSDYGNAPDREESPVLLEFVSANPTGPLHVGHGRGAAVGDTLARLLKTVGHRVETEYYVNDAGNQMKILGRSVLYRLKELMGQDIDFPEDHYKGEYIREIAEELRNAGRDNELLDGDEEEAVRAAADYAQNSILEGIRRDLDEFGVHFDRYFSERTLHDAGAVPDAVEHLRRQGKVEDRDGAVWFSMQDSEDEKDRVLVRATGEPTYFAADAAYHKDKIERGYSTLIDLWGSDHHGYVPRVKAAIEAMGYAPDLLKVLLVQFVTLVRGGRKLSMSTRSGEFITLREVIDEVGSDAARFFFLTKRCDSHLDFDLDLAKRQSRDNPVYYVQYAHARIASIFRIAEERGISADMSNPDLSALSLPEEVRIIKHLTNFPDMLFEAAEALEPHRVTFYLMDLAELFHGYYHDNKVLTEDDRVKTARLYLAQAVRQTIANGLSILGVTAPDRM